ncbi:hypothetical protein IAD21_00820 [Abditibacteriota bacterium]|nr:hypothetical protein IAD21_00820 [Abditibacteriota bacterium]
MHLDIKGRFEDIERQRVAVQESALALSEAQRNWTPNPDLWSVGLIVEHLVLSDEHIGRAQDGASTQKEELMFRILPRSVRRALILGALKRDMVLPLPSSDIEPRSGVPLSELLWRWERARDETRRLLDEIQSRNLSYWHPVLGPLTVAQMLELAYVHTAYHTRQIEVLRRNTAFPVQ